MLTHPHVVGELALGNLKQRDRVLEAVHNLASVAVAAESEVLTFIRGKALHGSGIGYVDAHLLAAVHLTPGASLWTFDRCLHETAARLDIAAARLH